ncbi:MAG: glutamate racemase [Zoogloeaceae bacterium]|jgi:glutamate racemase|nr:glutamate racemase [Zoogloeaceae bacterium]
MKENPDAANQAAHETSGKTARASDREPIAVWDSGLGGLTVLLALRARLPNEDFVYFADTRHFPYGDKPEDFLRARGRAVAAALWARGAKALVVACNTATAAAVSDIRKETQKPVIALEPALKPAVAASKTGVVGVLATPRTLESQRFSRLVADCAKNATVIACPCPGLAEVIEREGAQSAAAGVLLDRYLAPLNAAGADAVALGCTHYPWARKEIAARTPAGTIIVDSGEAVARQTEARLLRESHLGGRGRLIFAASDDAERFARAVTRLLAFSCPAEVWPV